MGPLFAAYSLLIAASGMGQAHPVLEKHVLGKWRYDLTSIRLTPSQALAKKLSDPHQAGAAKKQVADLKSSVRAVVAKVRMEFRKDHSLSVYPDEKAQPLLGGWTLRGRTLRVVMTDTRQRVPTMEVAPNGHRILAAFSDSSFGSLRIDLEKK